MPLLCLSACVSIQRVYRGWRVRCAVSPLRRLAARTERLRRQGERQQTEVEAAMRESERAVASARLTTAQAEREAATDSGGWRSVAQEARRRSGGEAAAGGALCCICCEPLSAPGSHRRLVLLSCAHRLHRSCLAAFESFTQGRELSQRGPQRDEAETEAEQAEAQTRPQLLFVPPGSLCPLCRSPYAKIADQPC